MICVNERASAVANKSVIEYVQEETKEFSQEQLAYLAWLCAVKALPFLSARKRQFSYWKDDAKQKHLYAIFNALDACVYHSYTGNAIRVNDDIAAAANSIKDYTDAFAANADKNYAAFATAKEITSSAFYVTTTAAFAANSFANTSVDKNYAVAAIAAVAVAAADDDKRMAFQVGIVYDILTIKKEIICERGGDISIYGKVWSNFHDDLKAIGCGYWAKLYNDLFINGFTVDKKELERRLNVPDEIKEQGAAAVARYLEGLGTYVERLNDARIIILGEKGAGKTSLARRLVKIDADMPTDDESTEGVSVLPWNLPPGQNDDGMNVHIWDFAGHTITHAAHRCFMSSRCLYIYVYNGRVEHDNRDEYWLEQIRIHGGNSPVLFLINKKDGHEPSIAKNTLKRSYDAIVDYYYADIGNKDTAELEKFRQTVMDMVRNNPAWNRQEISVSVHGIKEALRDRFYESYVDSIERDEFDKIAEANGVPDEEWEQILKYLHTLGICLWYDDMKGFNTLVLNPGWITNGIYKMINWGSKNGRHVLSVDHVEKILDRQRYTTKQILFLFKLMNKYELAFLYKNDQNQIFIPGLLPLDGPAELPDFPDSECLTMSFSVTNALPPNIVSRLIVLRHDEAKDESKLWRKGAVLYFRDGEAVAHVVEDARNVTANVKGKDRTPYIAGLRKTLKQVFESYKAIDPGLKYKVLLSEEAKDALRFTVGAEDKPQMLDENSIIMHMKKKRPYLVNDIDVDLEPTAKEYDIDIILHAKLSLPSRGGAKMERTNIYVDKNTGQINTASGNATIYAVQNNNVDIEKLRSLIADVKRNIPEGISSEDSEALNDNLEAIEEEMAKPAPRKGLVRAALAGLKNAKETCIEAVKFGAALSTLYRFIAPVFGWPSP